MNSQLQQFDEVVLLYAPVGLLITNMRINLIVYDLNELVQPIFFFLSLEKLFRRVKQILQINNQPKTQSQTGSTTINLIGLTLLVVWWQRVTQEKTKKHLSISLPFFGYFRLF